MQCTYKVYKIISKEHYRSDQSSTLKFHELQVLINHYNLQLVSLAKTFLYQSKWYSTLNFTHRPFPNRCPNLLRHLYLERFERSHRLREIMSQKTLFAECQLEDLMQPIILHKTLFKFLINVVDHKMLHIVKIRSRAAESIRRAYLTETKR